MHAQEHLQLAAHKSRQKVHAIVTIYRMQRVALLDAHTNQVPKMIPHALLNANGMELYALMAEGVVKKI